MSRNIPLLRVFLWTPKSTLPVLSKLERHVINVPQRQYLSNDREGWWINPLLLPLGCKNVEAVFYAVFPAPRSSHPSCLHQGLAGDTQPLAAFTSLFYSPTAWLAYPGITFFFFFFKFF